MTQRIYKHFKKTVEDYDTVANKVVFKNDELHHCLIEAIPFKKNAPINVLDLGSGTGHGMNLILNKFPKATVTGIDFSDKMNRQSKKNLLKYPGKFNVLNQDFNKFKFPEKYDVVISAIAIHNSTHSQKRLLFKKIYDTLKINGVFINGDFIYGENELINEHYRIIYKKYMQANLSGLELKTWFQHAFEDDMPMSLSKQFGILKKIGFLNIQLIWQFNNEAVYIAHK